MDAAGTREAMIGKGRKFFGLSRCRVFERPGDWLETSPFGERVHPVTGGKSFHAGSDGAVWTGFGLGESWIVAPLSGTVAAARDGVPGRDDSRPEGNFVEIDHGGGVRTRYLHLECGTVAVRAGCSVAAGERLGYMGASGRATGEHLHFELRVRGEPVDPAPFLRGEGVGQR
ncbi:MAG: M23 family metallopeptidase [Kiritimatiellae bacterium]|nr:M23 family metallopeptidase [Kiritimatiellia bacterium]